MITLDHTGRFKNHVKVDGVVVPSQLLEDPTITNGILIVRGYYDKRVGRGVYDTTKFNYQISPPIIEEGAVYKDEIREDLREPSVITYFFDASKLIDDIVPCDYDLTFKPMKESIEKTDSGHRILNLSGGATAISGLFGSAETVMKVRHYNPTVITGVSAGALLAVPLAMGKYNELKELVLNFNLKTIFSQSPVRKNGKLSLCAIKNIIQGKHYLGEMGNLIDTFERLITPEDWENFRHGDFPDVYVGLVNFKHGSSTYANLKVWNYRMAVQAIIASASIPVFSPGVSIGDWEYYDGGLRDHIISSQLLEKYDDIERVVSIYSRPKDYYSVDMDATRNIISVIERTIEIMNIEISKNDEYQEEHECFHREIPLSRVYLPRIMHHLWDTSPERIRKLYDMGSQHGMEVEI